MTTKPPNVDQDALNAAAMREGSRRASERAREAEFNLKPTWTRIAITAMAIHEVTLLIAREAPDAISHERLVDLTAANVQEFRSSAALTTIGNILETFKKALPKQPDDLPLEHQYVLLLKTIQHTLEILTESNRTDRARVTTLAEAITNDSGLETFRDEDPS